MSPAVFGHGHLRLYLLHVLAERPMHGYEIIQGLSDRFGGTYIPSAGTIYPRLGKLEEENLVTKQSDGRKTVYSITDAGRQELADRRDELEGIEDGVGDSVRRLATEVRLSVGAAMKELRAELAAAAREARDESRAAERGKDARARAAGPAGDAAASGHGTAEGASHGRSSSESDTGNAGDAGDAAGGSSASEPHGPRVTRDLAREQAQRADAALSAFRHDLRADLRTAAARGDVPAAAVDHLEQGLNALRAEVRALLG